MSQNLPAIKEAVREVTQTISFLLGSGRARVHPEKSNERPIAREALPASQN
jgi:hypothetical protein